MNASSLLGKAGRGGRGRHAPAFGRVWPRAIDRLGGWLLIAPGLALIAVFLLYPLLGVVLRSFDPVGLLSYSDPQFSTVNYSETWSEATNRIILRNTFVIATVATAISVAIAYPTAAFISRLSVRWTRVLLLLALIPFWTSYVVRTYALQLILKQTDVIFTTTASIIGMVSYLVPYLIILFYGGMVGIDENLLRSARSLGARPVRAFWHVFLPLSRPVVLAGTLLVFVIALGFFVTPALLGSAAGMTVSMFIQQQVNIAQWGVAASMAVGLLVASLCVYYVFNKLFGFERLAGSGVQVRRREGAWAPGRARRLRGGLGGWSVLVFAGLLAPLLYVILVSFSSQSFLTFPPEGLSLRWYKEVFSDPGWAESAWLSARVAVVATLFATVIGLLAAVALTRYRLPAAEFLRALFILPLIVPVVLIGAAEFDIQSRLHLSGTVLGYAIGHTVLALPVTVIICSTVLRQLGTSYDEAARSLGASRLTAFRLVTLPLILPSVAASAAFAFITSWDEPVMSLFLRGLTPTLPVRMYENVQQNVEPTVAAVATIVLAGVALVTMVVFCGASLGRRWRARRSAIATDGLTEATP